MATKRMAKDERRVQLLEMAGAIVRTEGTEALTLGYLAERAGVTKPVTYEHFGTRAGLLQALYRDYDERHTQAMRAALEAGGKTLEAVAQIVSAAYVDCVLSMGPEYCSIGAALSATEETEAFRRALREEYLAEYRQAFGPFTRRGPKAMRTLMEGLLGAADAISQVAAGGRTTRTEAVATLTAIMIGAVRAHPAGAGESANTRPRRAAASSAASAAAASSGSAAAAPRPSRPSPSDDATPRAGRSGRIRRA